MTQMSLEERVQLLEGEMAELRQLVAALSDPEAEPQPMSLEARHRVFVAAVRSGNVMGG